MRLLSLRSILSAGVLLLASLGADYGFAQVNVLTAHNDIGRTGQNLNEMILTPSNVNPSQFGKLFSHPVNGLVNAQPLYVSQVAVPGKGTHNVVYVVTSGDVVYAFDADNNGGINASPLWQASLTAGGSLTDQYGVLGTPVIDLSSKTMYLVSSEDQGSTYIFRLHAMDITTGAEKGGSPVLIQGSVAGTGSGSNGGVLTFDAFYHQQRPALLLLNGVVYAAFGSQGDNGIWHGWIFSYNETTLKQINIFCTTPNGSGGGIWMSGAGLAAEVNNSAKPYGRMFVVTGNGAYAANTPYKSTMSYGMSVLDLDLSGGVMTVEDEFTPYNQAALEGQDGDLGSGGTVLLPTQTLASGATMSPLVEIGKQGMIYILNRNDLGGFHAGADEVWQEIQTPVSAPFDWGAGVWGAEAYWNNTIYTGGTNPGSNSYTGAGNSLTAYSFTNGKLSATPSSSSVEQFSYPGPTPSISANGATNGIAWVLKTDDLNSLGAETLLAYNAANLGKTLYSSNDNLSRDTPGAPVEFVVPTIANGHVFVGASGQVSVYGLFADTKITPTPTISPGSGTFTGTRSVTLSDTLSGATIYYTTDGTTPTASSPVYGNTPLAVSTNETITAIASASGYLQSASASATYTSTNTTSNPVFSLGGGTYSGAQTLKLTDSSSGAAIYYTTDGSTPTSSSAMYSQPLTIPASETVRAIAVAPNLFASPAVGASYTIEPVYTIDFSQGFALARGPMQFNGGTDLDDFRLQVADGGMYEASSAFYATRVNIQAFTTDFVFQMSNPVGDGMTFTIQNDGTTALGGDGGGLGYAGIAKSVAIKFDLFSNAGEGPNSTGLYLDGVAPTVPAIDLSGAGINLHGGDFIHAHMTYDGTNLYLTLTDTDTLATWSHSFAVNIPAVVGGNTAYVGFTGGTGGTSSSDKVNSWTYVAGPPAPSYPAGFAAGYLTLNGGAAFNGSRLRLTDLHANEARSAFFTYPVNVQEFTTSFQFQLTQAAGDGFTFTIQAGGPSTMGASGGGLGYAGISKSVAVKFDLFSNAGEGSDSSGLYMNGVSPTIPALSLSSEGLNLHSGDIFNVQLTYNGTTLTMVIMDTVTNSSVTESYAVDIPSIVGGPTAYVGFTGGTGGAGSAIQEILNWTYAPQVLSGPSFASGFVGAGAGLTINGGAAVHGARLRLVNGGVNNARSAFSTTPVNVQQFTSNFQFQLTDPDADGITFTIQGIDRFALGSSGGGLGYAGIGKSVAVKFDLFSNAGEGPDSTGLYTNGATPTLPAVNLSSTGINLHNGNIFNVDLIYSDNTLIAVITDTVTHASETHTYSVNIPSIVGGSTAYVGFTGGSGGSSSVQDIVNWSYLGGS